MYVQRKRERERESKHVYAYVYYCANSILIVKCVQDLWYYLCCFLLSYLTPARVLTLLHVQTLVTSYIHVHIHQVQSPLILQYIQYGHSVPMLSICPTVY